ncbi:alpha/beta-hydrolase [Crucibulum laeve]|uniref:Alpha/beta-hydrolase n=1 Tax=Crucibulum laeve TaxID=68775 RepID=A0A5C3LWJ2_9AGAR|nr:alpha/beta-hydrolase [Crucibulum laeve]
MTHFTRDTISIPSVDLDVELSVWLYKPTTSSGPFPVVVAAHGFTLIKDAGLAVFGEEWASVGWASLIFDYRGFGDSGSNPQDKSVVSIKRQQEDYRTVIRWARATEQDSLFKKDTVVVMGSAMSGLHAAEVASNEVGIAGVMAHCPLLDGFKLFSAVPEDPQFLDLVAKDCERARNGDKPLFIPAVGKTGEPAFLNSPDTWGGFTAMYAQGATAFSDAPNLFAPRVVTELMSSRPMLKLNGTKIPILIIMAAEDDLIPRALTEEIAAQTTANIKLVVSPGGHFDVMKGGKGFETNITAQLGFLNSIA